MQKSLLTAAALCLLSQAPLVHATPANEGALEVLRVIDEACGDDWCEGPYLFSFQDVAFCPESNETQVSFLLVLEPEDEGVDEVELLAQSQPLTCTIPGFSNAETIIKSSHFLHSDFRLKLDTCFQNLFQDLRDQKA